MMVNATVEESLVGKPTAYLYLAASGLSCSMWDLSLWCTRCLSLPGGMCDLRSPTRD